MTDAEYLDKFAREEKAYCEITHTRRLLEERLRVREWLEHSL